MYNDFQEDKLSALDLAKQTAGYYINPLSRTMYSPSAWSPGRGGLRIYNPLAQGTLLNNPATRFTKDFISNKIGTFAAAEGSFWNKTQELSSKHVGTGIYNTSETFFGNLVSKGGVFEYNDGYIQLNTLETKNTRIYKHLKTNSNNALDRVNKLKAGTADIQQEIKLAKSTLSTAEVAHSQAGTSGVRGHQARKSRIDKPGHRRRLSPSMNKVTSAKQALTNILDTAEGKAASTASRGWGKALGKTMAVVQAEAAYNSAVVMEKLTFPLLRHAGRAVVRGVILLGKGASMYAVGSLMYDIASAVANPIAQAGVSAIDNTMASIQSMTNPNLGGQLQYSFLSHGASTERQRAIQAISRSRMNARSLLGTEANMAHS